MMDDDRPLPPVRMTSMRGEKNGPTSSSKEKDKDKKKGFFGKKNTGVCVCVRDIRGYHIITRNIYGNSRG